MGKYQPFRQGHPKGMDGFFLVVCEGKKDEWRLAGYGMSDLWHGIWMVY